LTEAIGKLGQFQRPFHEGAPQSLRLEPFALIHVPQGLRRSYRASRIGLGR